jgi:hypothetical protein
VTPRLTLNYGVRYMYQQPWRVRDNRVSFLDLRTSRMALPQDSDMVTTPPLAVASLMNAYPYETTKQAGWTASYYVGDQNNFGPRSVSRIVRSAATRPSCAAVGAYTTTSFPASSELTRISSIRHGAPGPASVRSFRASPLRPSCLT